MYIVVLNGPNLNMLGIRQPEIYGHETYEDLKAMIQQEADSLGVRVSFFQSNHEGALVDAIQQAYFDKADGIIINPGAYTHTSIALLDAVKAVRIPTVEVHISDPDTREEFRHTSYIRAACTAMGGLPLQAGDAGFEFTLLGNYRLRMLLWAGDDEFPPNAQILFSDNFPQAFSAEDRTVVGDIVISDIKRRM